MADISPTSLNNTFSSLSISEGDKCSTLDEVQAPLFFSTLSQGDYFLAYEMPDHVIQQLQAQLPITKFCTTPSRLNDLKESNSDYVPLSVLSQSLFQFITRVPPVNPLENYFSVLDMRDRVWSESKILDATYRTNQTGSSRAELLWLSLFQLKHLTDELVRMEEQHPDLLDDFRFYQSSRFSVYPESHPLRLIQPYLSSYRPPVPDYRPYRKYDLRGDGFKSPSLVGTAA